MMLQLFGQMLPLIVFIIVDTFCKDVRISIIAAILFAAGQLILYYLKTRSFDWFVILDVALIAGFGTMSIILKNEIFFKIKPAIIEAATIVFMLGIVFAPDPFLLSYFGRMLPKGMIIRPDAVPAMKTMLVWMCVYVAVHIGAVWYAAIYSSRKVWAFVSGPGFFFVFIPMMIFIFARRARLRKVSVKTGNGVKTRG